MNYFIKSVGIVVSFVISLPLPWKVRVLIAHLLQISLSFLMAYIPQMYDFIIGENRKYGMGKQNKGEMQSIMAMELVLCEAEKLRIKSEVLGDILAKAEKENISNTDLPKFIGENILGIKKTEELLKQIIAF